MSTLWWDGVPQDMALSPSSHLVITCAQGLLALEGITGCATSEAVLAHPHLKSFGSAVVTDGNLKEPWEWLLLHFPGVCAHQIQSRPISHDRVNV